MQPKRKAFLFLLILFLAFGVQIKPSLAEELSPSTYNRIETPVSNDSKIFPACCQTERLQPIRVNDDKPRPSLKKYLTLSLIFDFIIVLLWAAIYLSVFYDFVFPEWIMIAIVYGKMFFSYLTAYYLLMYWIFDALDYQNIDQKKFKKIRLLVLFVSVPLTLTFDFIIISVAVLFYDILMLFSFKTD